MSHEPPRPLRGLRVLELAQNLAGPYCTHVLAALGADVIKVEAPDGDAARAWGPPFVDGVGSIFAAANRGKRSIVLDLRTDADRLVLRRLIEESDILVEAFRPGALAKLGFGAGAVQQWNPRIIYCSVLAYGAHGPLSDLPGYDPLMQAHGGLMSVTGSPTGGPARVGTSVVDMGTGMWLTIAVLAALREREATDAGTHLTVALYDTVLAINAYHVAACADTGFVARPMGSELPMIAPYGAYPASDGDIMIAAANDGLFRKLCDALGLADVADDARFATNRLRVEHRTALNGAVAAITAQFTRAALLERLRRDGVPCAPIQDIAEVVADPQTAASGMVQSAGTATAIALPIRWNGVRPDIGTPPPRTGEHTEDVTRDVARERRS